MSKWPENWFTGLLTDAEACPLEWFFFPGTPSNIPSHFGANHFQGLRASCSGPLPRCRGLVGLQQMRGLGSLVRP